MRFFTAPEREEIEQLLESFVYELYLDCFGHRPESISCHFLKNEDITVVMESITSPSERLLLDSAYTETAIRARNHINQVFEDRLKGKLNETIKVPIIDILSDYQLSTDRACLFIILETRKNAESSD